MERVILKIMGGQRIPLFTVKKYGNAVAVL